MQIYLVGGAVRDTLLGLPVTDRDWVVVGSSPQEMTAKGFLSVGKDFPVFLHPVTKEEYALARTERKTAPGYHGFVFDTTAGVTLEQDLARRDITINSIAQDSTGQLIDPFGGQSDLAHKVLRHTSPAFVEDPVRILRVARFAARFADFSVAEPTLQLMQDMVAQGEVDALVPERVWQELSKGLMAAKPSRMLGLLAQSGALAKLLPQLADQNANRSPGLDHCPGLDAAAFAGASLPVRYACWLLPVLLQQSGALPQRLLPKVPKECSDLLALVHSRFVVLLDCTGLGAAPLLQLLIDCDAMRRPRRFEECLAVIRWAAPAAANASASSKRLAAALQIAQAIGVASLGLADTATLNGLEIAARLFKARVLALSHFLAQQEVV